MGHNALCLGPELRTSFGFLNSAKGRLRTKFGSSHWHTGYKIKSLQVIRNKMVESCRNAKTKGSKSLIYSGFEKRLRFIPSQDITLLQDAGLKLTNIPHNAR